MLQGIEEGDNVCLRGQPDLVSGKIAEVFGGATPAFDLGSSAKRLPLAGPRRVCHSLDEQDVEPAALLVEELLLRPAGVVIGEGRGVIHERPCPVLLPNGKRVIRLNGRNHNNTGFTMWFAADGVKPGTEYGQPDEFGYEAVVPIHDLHATTLHLLGLEHTKLTYRHAGRDFRLTDVYGKVMKDVTA